MEDKVDPLTVLQLEEEEKIISSHKICTVHPDHVDVSKIRDDLLKNKLEDQFYDSNVLGMLFCLFDTITYIPSGGGQAYTEVTEYLKALFTSLRRIGAESVNGNALLVSIKSTEGVLIAKSPKSKLNDELYHEYFVGAMVLNKLRRLTPNFAYILGAFKCLPPEIEADKRVSAWCEAHGINDSKSLVNYVLYEKVPGKSVEDLTETCSAADFFSWFVQICISHHIARGSEFTHYDLHTGNVMVRPWKDEDLLTIPYEVEFNLTWYVKAKTVVQMIDYGMSHVIVNGKHFGKRMIEHAGVHYDQYRPMFDLYKFLGFGLLQMLELENPEASKLIPVWALLNAELLNVDVATDVNDLKAEMMKQVDTYFALSTDPLPIEATYTVWDWIQAMRRDPVVGKMWTKIVSSEPSSVVLTCGDTCPVPAQIEEEITGSAFEEVQESLHSVKFATSKNDKSAAMSALPSQVIALRRQMASFRAELIQDMEKCSEFSYSGSNAIETSQFQDFVTNYVEPFISVKTRLQQYEGMRLTLCEYYNLKGKACDTAEFDFGTEFSDWNTNLKAMTSKMDRFCVTNRCKNMREQILTML